MKIRAGLNKRGLLQVRVRRSMCGLSSNRPHSEHCRAGLENDTRKTMEGHDQLLKAKEKTGYRDGREVQEVSGMNSRRSLRPSAHEKTIRVKLGQDVRRHPQHQQLQQWTLLWMTRPSELCQKATQWNATLRNRSWIMSRNTLKFRKCSA